MTLVRQNRVVATIFAFLRLAVPSCDGFLLSPSFTLARLRPAPKVCVFVVYVMICVCRMCETQQLLDALTGVRHSLRDTAKTGSESIVCE